MVIITLLSRHLSFFIPPPPPHPSLFSLFILHYYQCKVQSSVGEFAKDLFCRTGARFELFDSTKTGYIDNQKIRTRARLFVTLNLVIEISCTDVSHFSRPFPSIESVRKIIIERPRMKERKREDRLSTVFSGSINKQLWIKGCLTDVVEVEKPKDVVIINQLIGRFFCRGDSEDELSCRLSTFIVELTDVLSKAQFVRPPSRQLDRSCELTGDHIPILSTKLTFRRHISLSLSSSRMEITCLSKGFPIRLRMKRKERKGKRREEEAYWNTHHSLLFSFFS